MKADQVLQNVKYTLEKNNLDKQITEKKAHSKPVEEHHEEKAHSKPVEVYQEDKEHSKPVEEHH